MPNVPVTIDPDSQASMAHRVLTALLASPPPPAAQGANSARVAEPDGTLRGSRRHRAKPSAANQSPDEDDDTGSTLRISKVVPAGDVLHVFSHIRKTYRIQWVLLLGNRDDDNGPPPLVSDPDLTALEGAAAPAKRKPQAKKTKKSVAAVKPPTTSAPTTQWVRMDAVADAKYVLSPRRKSGIL